MFGEVRRLRWKLAKAEGVLSDRQKQEAANEQKENEVWSVVATKRAEAELSPMSSPVQVPWKMAKEERQQQWPRHHSPHKKHKKKKKKKKAKGSPQSSPAQSPRQGAASSSAGPAWNSQGAWFETWGPQGWVWKWPKPAADPDL